MNILIAEPLAPAGIELFQSEPGWTTIVSTPKQYAEHLAEADALLVRSAVQVTREVLRIFLGIGNDDVPAALGLKQLDPGRRKGLGNEDVHRIRGKRESPRSLTSAI
jgi:hypothetical protein